MVAEGPGSHHLPHHPKGAFGIGGSHRGHRYTIGLSFDVSWLRIFTGAVCGSAILDERFETFLADTLGRNMYQNLSLATKRIAMKHCQDYLKPNYAGTVDADGFDDAGYSVPMSGIQDSPNINLNGGLLYLERYLTYWARLRISLIP